MEEREEQENPGFPEADEEGEDQSYRRLLAEKYKELMRLYLVAHEAGQGGKLSLFLDFLEARGASEWYEQRYFYQFWLILHQRSPVRNEDKENEEGKTILDQALALLGNRVMYVREGKGIIKKSKRFAVQELLIELEDETDELS
jgi:hypothetical protein